MTRRTFLKASVAAIGLALMGTLPPLTSASAPVAFRPSDYTGWTLGQLEAKLATMGDGEQDCTAIIQAILNKRAQCRFPNGTYLITGRRG